MTLQRAYRKDLATVFFIDHWIGKKIKDDKNFKHLNTLLVVTENKKNSPPNIDARHIEIFENNEPQDFFDRQRQQVQKEMSADNHSKKVA